MSNVYQMIIDEFKARNTADYNKFPPYFIISTGAHYFNLINQQRHIFVESGLTANTRLHIIMIAPQGQSKSFWLKQFLENQNSILNGTAISTDFELRMSEAGYVGTIKFGDKNQIIETQGLCQEEASSIVGIEEFSDLMKSVTAQDYNIGLENELLTTLDSGMAIKRLAAGKLEYRTNLTLWTATQPARYNLTSGLGRRFLFIFNIPTEKSMKDLIEKQIQGDNVTVDQGNLFELKKAMNMKFDDITTKLNKISFSSNFYDHLKRFNIANYEYSLYKRLGLGYMLMRNSIESEMTIDLDPTLRKLIKTQWGWRKKVKQGTEDSMIWTFIESADNLRHERCLEVLMDFGMDLKNANKSIRELQKKGLIIIENGFIRVKKEKILEMEPEEMIPEVVEHYFPEPDI